MTASDWAAWTGAIAGVVALAWEIVRWWREGPRLLVRTSAYMKLMPDTDGRLLLMVWVTNVGTVTVTLTSCGMFTFSSWWTNHTFRPSRSWVFATNAVGPELPQEIQPAQQWTCGVRKDAELSTLIEAGTLYIGVYHAAAPLRPVLRRVVPEPPKPMSHSSR